MAIKVLILDDDREVLEVYRDDLADYREIQTVVFDSPSAAMTYFKRNPDVKVVISDVNLRGLYDGNKFIGDVIAQCRNVKIGILTADPYSADSIYRSVGVKIHDKPTPIHKVLNDMGVKLRKAA